MKGLNVTLALVLALAVAAFGCGADSAETADGLVINEVVPKATGGAPDWVELNNVSTVAVDLSGIVIKDEKDTHEFEIPAGTMLEAGEFLIIEGEGGTGDLVLTFGLGGTDSVRIFDSAGNLVDSTSWVSGQADEGTSWGRSPDFTGDFVTLSVPTPGQANSNPL